MKQKTAVEEEIQYGFCEMACKQVSRLKWEQKKIEILHLLNPVTNR